MALLVDVHRRHEGVPVIETERLCLRGHGLDDLAASTAMWGDETVTRFIGGRPFTAEEVWARLLRYVGHWTLLGFGYWVVADKATGAFLGEAGFSQSKRDLKSSLADLPEIGWALTSAAQGRGYVTEAVRAVTHWGDQHFVRAPTMCMIHPDNTASLRVAEKCGYHEFERTAYRGQPALIFKR